MSIYLAEVDNGEAPAWCEVVVAESVEQAVACLADYVVFSPKGFLPEDGDFLTVALSRCLGRGVCRGVDRKAFVIESVARSPQGYEVRWL